MSAAWRQEVTRPGFLAGLDALARMRRSRGGAGDGRDGGRLRRSSGLEWSDHAPYAPGDELRYLNWPLYSRTDRPWVRTFCSERSDRVDLLVDRSRSMSLGRPPKIDRARALAFVFGYVVLGAGGRVGAAAVGAGLGARLPGAGGPAAQARLLEFLGSLEPDGGTRLGPSLLGFSRAAREVGEVVLISDLLDPDWAEGLRALRSRGFGVTVLRLRADCDDAPGAEASGGVWVDVESGRRRTLRLDADWRDRFRELRREDRERDAATCRGGGATLASLASDRPLDDLVFGELRRPGLLGG